MATRKERVILDLDPGPYVRGLATAKAATAGFIAGLDTSNDRAALLTQSLLAVGPALVPLSAAAVGPLAGLSTQLGFAAAGAGTMALAFAGIGDALEKLNKFQFEPTAENLENLRESLQNLGPAARSFVMFLDDIGPRLQKLREEAQGELLPDVQVGIEEMLDRLPQVRDIIEQTARAAGELAIESGEALSSEDWDEFFDFLENEAQPVLLTFGRTVGNVFEGLANTWMALDPLSDGFAQGLLDWSRDFADATDNLDESERFQAFLAYVQENGPRAAEALGAIGGAAVSLVEAAAPVGEVALPVIEALADALAAVLRSPAGPVLLVAASGISAISRAIGLYNAANGSALLGFLRGAKADGGRASSALSGVGKAIAGFAGVTAAFAALDALNSRLDETLPGLEALKGQLIDLANVPAGFSAAGLSGEFDSLGDSIERVADGRWDDGLQGIFDAVLPGDNRSASLREATAEIAALDAALTSLVDSGDADVAKDALSTLIDQYGLTAGQVDKLMPLLTGYNEALARQANEADLAAGGQRKLEHGLYRSEKALYRQEQAALAAKAALQESREAARDTADSFIDLAEGVDDTKTSFSDWLSNLEDQAKALRNFRINAREAGENGIDKGLIRHLQELGPEGARQMAWLADATEDGVRRANKAWRAISGQVEAYTDKVGGVKPANLEVNDKGFKGKIGDAEARLRRWERQHPTAIIDADDKPARTASDRMDAWMLRWGRSRESATIDADEKPAKEAIFNADSLGKMFAAQQYTAEVDADTSGVQAAVSETERWLNSIQDEIVYVTVKRRGGGVQEFGADGATVPKTGLPYADRHPYMLADGEEIISNRYGQADKNRFELKAANAGAKLAVVGFGDGGTASSLSGMSRLPGLVGESRVAAMGGGTRVVERVVEVLPRGRVVAHIEGFGDVAMRFAAGMADQRIDADREYRRTLEGDPR